MIGLRACLRNRVTTARLAPFRQSHVRPNQWSTLFTTCSRLRHSSTFARITSTTNALPQGKYPPTRTSWRSYYQNHHRNYQPRSDWAFNQNVTRACLGSAVIIYVAWDYSENGITYTILEKQRAYLQSMGVSVPRSLNTRAVNDFLNKYFLLHANDPHNYAAWLGAAFSHHGLLHLGLNLMIWSSFAKFLYMLPRAHYAAVILGSALASSGVWLADSQSKLKSGAALGSSGIVEGVLATATMFYPTMPVAILGIFPAQLWMMTAGFFALDYYLMQESPDSMIGHSAHVGGAVFGVVYYTIFLRKFGGILGRRF